MDGYTQDLNWLSAFWISEASHPWKSQVEKCALGSQRKPFYISDYGLHLVLNPTSQEMLEAAAAQAYKAPELIKMRECNMETDVSSLGVILLEILTGKGPVNEKPTAPGEDYHLTNTMPNAILDHRVSDLFHMDILLSKCSNGSRVTEERILKFFQLAMACRSPSLALRPNARQVVAKLEEISC